LAWGSMTRMNCISPFSLSACLRPSSWSTRLAALDAASVRLSHKTSALNDLLRQLQHATSKPSPRNAAGPKTGAAAAAAQATPAAVHRITPPRGTALKFPASSPPTAAAPVDASTSLQRIADLQAWLTRLAQQIEHAGTTATSSSSSSSSSASSAGVSSSALNALSHMHELMLSEPIGPAPAVLPTTHSALVTIKSLNSVNTVGAGVPVPKNRGFINGRWQKVQGSPKHSRQGSLGAVSDEEEDPFANISDMDAESAPASGRASAVNSPPGKSPPGHVRKGSSLGTTEENRREGQHNALEIDAEDGEQLMKESPASKRKVQIMTPSKSSVEDDPFADIDDLEVDMAEEEVRRKAELARAAALKEQHSIQGAKLRAQKNKSKMHTLRGDLSKHMHQDADIDTMDEEAIVAAAVHPKSPQKQFNSLQQQQPSSTKSHPAAANAQPSVRAVSPIQDDALDEMDDDDDDQGQPSLPKNAPGVTALTTRREGQEVQTEEWHDVDDSGVMKKHHPKALSQSLSLRANEEDRPDDLDDMEDGDEEPVKVIKTPKSPGSRKIGFQSEPDDAEDGFHTPEHSQSRHSQNSNSSLRLNQGSGGGTNHGQHGQLASSVSDDDLDHLDDFMDEDEVEQSKMPVKENKKADVDRAGRDRQLRNRPCCRWNSVCEAC
jgi:hypothetical protein